MSQTTLRPQDVAPVIEALSRRFPTLVQPAAADICYATSHRQAAIEWLAGQVDVVLVVGDATSSNSHRLREAAAATGRPAYLIGTAAELDDAWLVGVQAVGVSAGASTPDDLVRDVVESLCRDGALLEERVFMDERVVFRLPDEVATRPEPGAERRQVLPGVSSTSTPRGGI